MQALVYTDTETLIYREEKNPKLLNGESIVKVSAQEFVDRICMLTIKEIHNGKCAAPKIILLI